MDYYSVIQSPVVTEKSEVSKKNEKYTFLVRQGSNKIEIAHAIEKMYGVEVDKVNIIPVLKKVRKIGRSRTFTKRKAAKKAVVTLKKGTIDINKLKTT